MCLHNLVLCLLTVVGVCRVLLVVGDDNSVLVGKIGISSVVGVAAASVGRFGLAMLANQIYHWVWVRKSRKKPKHVEYRGSIYGLGNNSWTPSDHRRSRCSMATVTKLDGFFHLMDSFCVARLVSG